MLKSFSKEFILFLASDINLEISIMIKGGNQVH